MKKYIPIPVFHDTIFGKECDPDYIAECMANGMPEEDMKHLLHEFGAYVLSMFEIKEGDHMGRVYTEAQAKATKAYYEKQTESGQVQIIVRMTKEDRERLQKAAAASGKAQKDFVMDALNEAIKKEIGAGE